MGLALPNAPVIQLAAAVGMPTGDGRTGELRAATYGRGIWQIPLLTAVTAAQPAMTLSSTALSFAAQAVGTASAAQTVTVTNTGNAALTVSQVAVTGDFTEADTCTAGADCCGVELCGAGAVSACCYGRSQRWVDGLWQCRRWSGYGGVVWYWDSGCSGCAESGCGELSGDDCRGYECGAEHYDLEYGRKCGGAADAGCYG